jgi:elongation factor P
MKTTLGLSAMGGSLRLAVGAMMARKSAKCKLTGAARDAREAGLFSRPLSVNMVASSGRTRWALCVPPGPADHTTNARTTDVAERAVKIRAGNVIRWRGENWRVLDTQQTFTGKHGAYFQMKLQSLSDGHVETNRFGSNENIDRAYVETKRMQYLYQDGVNYVFMDPKTGEQILLGEDMLKGVIPYMPYNADVEIQFVDEKPVAAELPASVVLEVTYTEPAVKGDTATSVTKPAEVETGVSVKVPGHVKIGDKISVDTRTGEFLGRA